MPRARTVKYDFFRNESLGYMPPHARLLFVGLWCLADREGRLEDRPGRIKLDLFGYEINVTPEDVDALLALLDDADLIRRYTVDSVDYIAIVKWSKHQHPHPREVASVIPEPTKERPRHGSGKTSAMNGHGLGKTLDTPSRAGSSIPSGSSMPSGSSGSSGSSDTGRSGQCVRHNPRARAKDEPGTPPTGPATITLAMRQASIRGAQPSNPRIIALAEAGVTGEVVNDACEEAHQTHPGETINASYVLSIIERWQRDGHSPPPSGHASHEFDSLAKDRKRVSDALTGHSRKTREMGEVVDVAAKEIGHDPRDS